MAQPCFKASAPGSLMIMGEYAVLQGYHALVAAIDKRIAIEIIPRTDRIIDIDSNIGKYKTTVDNIQITAPFEYVLTALKQQKLNAGCNICINSQFSHEQGLGSSAAVTVATLAALQQWQKKTSELMAIYQSALKIVHEVQGGGSGADIAASLFGGLIDYCASPLQIKKLKQLPKISVFFSGSKTTTKEALKKINDRDNSLIKKMGELSHDAIQALNHEDLNTFGKLMNKSQTCFEQLHLSTPAIDSIITQLKKHGAHGVKISGSGLGDCVISLGKLENTETVNPLLIELSNNGLCKNFSKDYRATNKEGIVQRIIPHHDTKKTVGRAYAPSNIALAKYWGKRDQTLNLPMNSSLSISLADKGATVTVQLANQHRVIINKQLMEINEKTTHLIDYLQLFGSGYEVNIDINIPIAAGLASSACIFAALVLALNDLYQWQLDNKSLSILARLGSGSAARSITTGFVEWHKGVAEDGSDSYAESLPVDWPEFCVGLCIISHAGKKISSRQGMQHTVETSPLYAAWPKAAENALIVIKKAIAERDFVSLGKAAEHNALTLHATMNSAWPSICYSTVETFQQIEEIRNLREQGIDVYFTQDAGPNLKLLFLEKDKQLIQKHFNPIEIISPFRRQDEQ